MDDGTLDESTSGNTTCMSSVISPRGGAIRSLLVLYKSQNIAYPPSCSIGNTGTSAERVGRIKEVSACDRVRDRKWTSRPPELRDEHGMARLTDRYVDSAADAIYLVEVDSIDLAVVLKLAAEGMVPLPDRQRRIEIRSKTPASCNVAS
jgi:hypothetical protein